MVLMAVLSRPEAAKCRRTFWTECGQFSTRLKTWLALLTDVDSGSALRGDHHILELVQGETLTRHRIHGVVQHLACSVSVLDLVSR